MHGISFSLYQVKQLAWLKALIYGVLIVITYRSALAWLVWHDWPRKDYSHCAIIPLVILYLIWEKRVRLALVASSPSWLGLIPFALGIALFWIGELGGEFFAMYLSLWLVVVGLLWMHFGWKKIKVMGFALLMALTMFPFPHLINDRVLLKLKLISSHLGVAILQIYGMSAYREGNVIDLGFTQLQVVDACSGLRFMLPLIVLSLIIAHGCKAAFWKQAVLVVSSIPVSILMNSFRIAMTGILYCRWGEAVAEGFFHGFSGWLIFMFTLPVLLLEMWMLNKIGKRGKVKNNNVHERLSENNLMRPDADREPEKFRKAMLQPVFIAAILVFTVTLAFSRGIEFRERIPVNKPFRAFPMTIGEWTGSHGTMDADIVKSLDLNDYVMATYYDSRGKTVNFYVAYYESQRKGEATHSPETCLPASGWKFEHSSLRTIAVVDGRHLRVSRVLANNNGLKQLVYFWFPQRGRVLTSLYQVKLYAFWDALTRKRTDGALVRVITQVYPGETMAAADNRVQDFIRGVVPVIDEYLPD